MILSTRNILNFEYNTYSVCKSSIKILSEGEEGGYIDMISVNEM